MKPLTQEQTAALRRTVEDARLKARLMRPSGYAADALRADVEYLRGADNVADMILNMIDPQETTDEAMREVQASAGVVVHQGGENLRALPEGDAV